MQFNVIDLNSISSKDLETLDSCYKLWHEVYTPILADAQQSLNKDSFLRARFLAVLEKDAEVCCFSLMNTHFTLWKPSVEASYFSYCSDITRHLVKSQGLSLLTVEWLTANPKYRRKVTGYPANEVLVSLCFQWMKHMGFDAAIGYPRCDFKSDQVATMMGAKVTESVMRHGIECKVILAHRDSLIMHPETEMAQHIQDLMNKNFIKYPKQGAA
ncbi:MAG: hypothetical protein ACK5UJ_03830 [Pseudobdellovibrionaceae bacterium]|jgi:hypothetical protein|nr:hypothetical protein [Pseudanabaena sp. M151S2SP2A07QC]